MIEKIVCDERIFAIVIRAEFKSDGLEFFTPSEFSQQLAYMSRPKGYMVEPHIHVHADRKVNLTQEVLIVKSGKARVDFYNDDHAFLRSIVICKGDVILLASGGHGFEFLEPTEMIEVKQGPYTDQNDKVQFTVT